MQLQGACVVCHCSALLQHAFLESRCGGPARMQLWHAMQLQHAIAAFIFSMQLLQAPSTVCRGAVAACICNCSVRVQHAAAAYRLQQAVSADLQHLHPATAFCTCMLHMHAAADACCKCTQLHLHADAGTAIAYCTCALHLREHAAYAPIVGGKISSTQPAKACLNVSTAHRSCLGQTGVAIGGIGFSNIY